MWHSLDRLASADGSVPVDSGPLLRTSLLPSASFVCVGAVWAITGGSRGRQTLQAPSSML